MSNVCKICAIAIQLVFTLRNPRNQGANITAVVIFAKLNSFVKECMDKIASVQRGHYPLDLEGWNLFSFVELCKEGLEVKNYRERRLLPSAALPTTVLQALNYC
ncbi:hypothetical protein DXZ20_20885 [Leptolyngbyaceae cyanobacterium CCMR0081]|uniref:Uncharacterized protein n=1 Tax=Adonisia turfae CCMR0081 TaxID=2292702 RepID=A0A6M0RPG0_9CYAN|nr:hypothetical protein [Adonisia turfae CCMR0081]